MEKIHFSKGRETKAICDDKKFGAIGFDMENKEQMFFDRDITERCPYCETMKTIFGWNFLTYYYVSK